MQARHIAIGFALGLGTALVTGHALSQQDGRMPSPEEMMQALEEWKASMQPGPSHEALEYFVGEWDTTMRIWFMGPDAPPTETAGTATYDWMLGGRYLRERYEGSMMLPDAQGRFEPIEMEGFGITGYDNTRNVYFGTWMDTLGTHMLTFKGNVDQAGTTWTYYGEMDEPMLNVTGRMIKYVTRVVDADTFVFEVYDLHVADDYKSFEIEQTRRRE